MTRERTTAPAALRTAIATLPGVELSSGQREALHSLFDATYERADHDYLDRSLELLRTVALAVAEDAGGEGETRRRIIGFALGERRIVDLPGLPAQPVALAGLCCVDRDFRRSGLFRSLAATAVQEGIEPASGERVLGAGRMAHPASFRMMRASGSAVPSPGFMPSAYQQEVGSAVAGCYGVEDFDPLTFVCHGKGRPIGTPRMKIEASVDEWNLFGRVDRERGDSLLALCWLPDAPPGW